MLKLLLAVSLACAILGAVPAIARPRSCGDAGSLRSGVDEALSTIEITNRRATPATVEWIDPSGVPTHRLTLAPGGTTQLPTYRTHAWVGRDARRRCLSGFVADEKTEAWELVPDGDDYERLSAGGLTVYVAPEFHTRDQALLEQCLQFLETSAKRIEQAVPADAWQYLSKVPIWLEYESGDSYRGVYFPNVGAKAQSVQFDRSLAAMIGYKMDPLMHELAHAYHDLVLSFAYRPILTAYEHARAGGLYNAVPDVWGRRDRAYAITNHHEYFAELSVAYFGTNYYFPFTRHDLKEFDPVGLRSHRRRLGTPNRQPAKLAAVCQLESERLEVVRWERATPVALMGCATPRRLPLSPASIGPPRPDCSQSSG